MTRGDYSILAPGEVRSMCRTGTFTRHTAGVARGYVQANLVVVRSCLAGDFERFCRLNPKPCPILEVLEPGAFEPMRTAPGADLRTDLPRYRVFRDGLCADRPTDVLRDWAEDTVAFLIGCSFTFESALLEAGLPVRHVEEGCNVPMYSTSVACEPAGSFQGRLIVSMRPMTPEQAREAERITSRYERVHGAPVHVGSPAKIGIADLARPDYGDSVSIRPGEVPVFWACGVTPMETAINSGADLLITHEPGHMFVTDLADSSLIDP